MKKIINYINDSGSKNLNFLLFLILTTNLVYNLFFRYNYSIPYGFDEIITIWPVGQELIKSNLIDWPNILFSRFLSEDHLFPVTNFFTYFICKLNGNIIENLYWISRLCYIIILGLSIILIKNIGFTRANIFYFIIIFLNAGPINFGILSYNFNFNLVCIFSLLTLIFYLKPQKTRNTLLFLFFCFLGTFTSENFYIIYPTILFIFWMKKTEKGNSRSLFVIIFFLAILIFKFFLSFKYLGIIMPNSRLNLAGSSIFFNALSVVFKVFNNMLFGLPLYFIQSKNIWALIILILFSVSFVIYIRYYKKNKELILFYLILVILPFIGYTGRFHPGMWTFVELIGIFFIALIFSKIFNKAKSYLFFILILFGLFSINFIIDPYSNLKKFNNESYESSNLSYSLIESRSDKIVIYNLTDSTPPMHPIAFWIGSKIYNNNQGLNYKPEDRSLHMYGIDIESINIDKYDTLFKIMVTPQKNVTTLVKTKNSFIKMKYSDGIISEYSIFGNYKRKFKQEYDVINPFYKENRNDTFSVKIFTRKRIEKYPIKIKLLKTNIFGVKLSNNLIKFDFVSRSIFDQLILDNIKLEIDKIVIKTHSHNTIESNQNTLLRINSDKRAFFKLFNSNYESYGYFDTLEDKTLLATHSLNSNLINVQFWFFDNENKKWKSFVKKNYNINNSNIISFKNNQIF